MNYENLTEEQFTDMAEELCLAWCMLDVLHDTIKEYGGSEVLKTRVRLRQQSICHTLGQDATKEPQWPPVRKFKVGLTQLRTVEYIAEVEVSAGDEVEAEELAFELARKDAAHWTSRLDWEENGESTDHERRLDDGTWCCEPV